MNRIFRSKTMCPIFSLASILMCLILSSCEEVIDADLSKAEPLIVIEGSISDQSEVHTVKVSKTIAFDQPTKFNGVPGAKVTVYSSNSQTYTFTSTGDGTYKSQRFRGTPGVSYILEVITGGKTYKASSLMPAAVKPDSINFKKLTFFGDSKLYPSIYYKDPPRIQNQYRYIVKINGVLKADQVSEDRFSDGNATSDLITFDGDGVVAGDKVDVEIQCIDRNVFKYYFAISQIGGNGGPPVAPSNPESNLDNGALGIFSANTRSAYTISLK
ncbi:DUF4249 domain-containing protein [Daejeonella lutea]|uniref:DUF4249 domain-containing protein n=1 Tax=Daejeonella lutea TaxID=572036 RepID=A0A1T5DJD2_9SPHI|nr:DUF4249 domain-containing protein [Daejeonella lutea]SKB71533.1 protein of unknown function [Daejeonella lutea]